MTNPKSQIPNPKSRSRGFTLVELLVVVAMLIILVGVLTTAMQPVLAGKEIREAARGLNAYIAASVARAAETGRPAGIWIQRQPGANANAAFDVFFADVPPLYAGDATNAVATFSAATPTTVSLTAGQASVAEFINIGDHIRFWYAGPWYEITDVDTTGPEPLVTFAYGPKPPPPYGDDAEVPYQIQRRPRPSPVQPYQMPANTIIDLSMSGIGVDARFASAEPNPVIILFSPDGSVERIHYHNGIGIVSERPMGAIHLLIGRRDQLGAGNLASQENRWVSVTQQTGRVITAENMGGPLFIDDDGNGKIDDDPINGIDDNGDGTPDNDPVNGARQFARSSQGMGGS